MRLSARYLNSPLRIMLLLTLLIAGASYVISGNAMPDNDNNSLADYRATIDAKQIAGVKKMSPHSPGPIKRIRCSALSINPPRLLN